MCFECEHDYDSLADEIALEGRQEWDHESRLGDDTSEYDDELDEDEDWREDMDGDFDSAMTSAGFGTDEDYGYYGDSDWVD